MKPTTQGPSACLFGCVYMTMCVAVTVYISVYLCLLSPSIQASKYACVYVHGVSVCP